MTPLNEWYDGGRETVIPMPDGHPEVRCPHSTVENAKSGTGFSAGEVRAAGGKGDVSEGTHSMDNVVRAQYLSESPNSRGEGAIEDGLERVRAKSILMNKQGVRSPFTALWHLVTPGYLTKSFRRLRKDAAAGLDQVDWQTYDANSDFYIPVLHKKLHNDAFRACPVRRVWIPKADGKKRPLGIACIEDKIVQRAIMGILEAIYEPKFAGFSYGFRPGRGCHDALDAVSAGIVTRNIEYIVDADIKGCFDNIPQDLLMGILREDIADEELLRHIDKFFKAGVLDNGDLQVSDTGVVQGSLISPILANIFLGHVIDKWVNEWRQKLGGDVIFVRYADDFIAGFQYLGDATTFLQHLKKRLADYKMELHPDKTRLIEFGKSAIQNRKRRGEGAPETFDFLGFTHSCRVSRKGNFVVNRHTIKKRSEKKLKELGEKFQKILLAAGILKGLISLRRALTGYYNYFAVPENIGTLRNFRFKLCRIIFKAIGRRSQKSKWNWGKFNIILAALIPSPVAVHDYPSVRFTARQAELLTRSRMR